MPLRILAEMLWKKVMNKAQDVLSVTVSRTINWYYDADFAQNGRGVWRK